MISAAGRDVEERLSGRRVAIEPNFPCGKCPTCHKGLAALRQTRGSLALNIPGLFAEYAVVPSQYCWELPADLRDELAVVVEPVAVCLAAIRRSGLLADPACRRVLVGGAGALGLLIVECLRLLGCDTSVLERDRRRLSRSLQSGVVAAHDPDGDVRYEVVFDSGERPFAQIFTPLTNPRVVALESPNPLASDPAQLHKFLRIGRERIETMMAAITNGPTND